MSFVRFGKKRFQDKTAIILFLQQSLASLQPSLQALAEHFNLDVSIEIAERPFRLTCVFSAKSQNQCLGKQLPEQLYHCLAELIRAYDNFFVHQVANQAKESQSVTMELRIDDYSKFVIIVNDDDEHFDTRFYAVN